MTSGDEGSMPATVSELDPEVTAFDDLCRQLSGFDDRMDTEWVDGYLTALAATWRQVPTAEWLPRMSQEDGHNAFERAYSDPHDAAQATQVLDKRLATLRLALHPDALLDEPDVMRLAPLIQVWDDDTRAQVVSEGLATPQEAATLLSGSQWAIGFMTAVSDFEADWPEPGGSAKVQTADADVEIQELFSGLITTVASLAWDPASPEYQDFVRSGWKDGNPTRDEHIDEACFAVQDLRVYWLDHAPKHPPRRAAPQPGRNDLCPCGSGKKYKRCHGAT